MGRLFALLVILGASPAWATNWTVTQDQSKLGFEATQMGASFEGQFKEFQATIVFDPENLADSKVDIIIPIASVDTQSADRDSNIAKPEWFDVATYPEARFMTTSIAKEGEGYVATAELTMRGVTKVVQLPFTVDIEGQNATAAGDVTVVRQDFGIGQGEWVANAVVGGDVRIFFDLKATAQ